ncbi:unnamed protein product [Alopecurus aequalis]
MEVLYDTTGKKEVVVYYMDAPVPYAIEENYGGCFFEDDVDLALVLQDQEIVYQLLQGNDGSGSSGSHSYPSSSCGHQRTLGEQKIRGGANYESQLAVDETLAREMQEIEDQISYASIDDNILKAGKKPASSSTPSNGSTCARRSRQVVTEDSVDPDNMTYEELQQLGETIGTESKGLPEDVIALLKSSTYKIRLFSRKEKHVECVICCMDYKNRDKLTTLPCEHQYHQTCVAQWLKINKVCPVCNKEVFGSYK